MNPIEAKNQQKHIHTETHLASVFDKVFDKVFVCFYFYLFFFKKWLINGNWGRLKLPGPCTCCTSTSTTCFGGGSNTEPSNSTEEHLERKNGSIHLGVRWMHYPHMVIASPHGWFKKKKLRQHLFQGEVCPSAPAIFLSAPKIIISANRKRRTDSYFPGGSKCLLPMFRITSPLPLGYPDCKDQAISFCSRTT